MRSNINEGLVFPNPSFNQKVEKMKEYAVEFNVPIISEEGLECLLNIIKENNIKSILEIGSAIGYSSINMALSNDCNIVTIERNNQMYTKAVENIKSFNLENQIKVIYKDALDAYDDVKNYKFDMIFIDAAKSQYKKFFNLYENLLNEKGIIVSDNLLFHGLVDSIEKIESRNLRALIRKLKGFRDFLLENENYETVFIDAGDGLGVSKKK